MILPANSKDEAWHSFMNRFENVMFDNFSAVSIDNEYFADHLRANGYCVQKSDKGEPINKGLDQC